MEQHQWCVFVQEQISLRTGSAKYTCKCIKTEQLYCSNCSIQTCMQTGLASMALSTCASANGDFRLNQKVGMQVHERNG